MSEIALASLNTFGITSPKDNFVTPSEQLITLNYDQLQNLIKDAVQEAIQPLQNRIESLETTMNSLQEDLGALTTTEEQDINRLSLDIAYDRQRIARLEQSPIKPLKGEKSLARIAKIDEILKVKGSTTLKELERVLKIRPQEMSRLVARLDMRRYDIFLRDGDEREKVLRLKVQIR